MSLTLFFIVLSVAIGYLLYDTFKKSRQKQTKNSQVINNRLKINYTQECAVLNTLSKQKMDNIKSKTISIHLSGQGTEASEAEIVKVRSIISKLLVTRRIYLLENKNQPPNKLFQLMKELVGPEFTIPYTSLDGAVAILRQMSCGLHLESQIGLHLKIRQYIHKIWLVGEDPEQQAIRQFKTQAEMLSFLSNMQAVQEQPN